MRTRTFALMIFLCCAVFTMTEINIALALGSISGTVTSDGVTGIQNVFVRVYNTSNTLINSGITGANGAYTVSGLAAGTYKVCFDAFLTSYLSECWNDKPDVNTADPVPVTDPGTTTTDAVLTLGGSIWGRVTADGVTPIPGVAVDVWDTTCLVHIKNTYTSADGTYAVAGLFTGTYRVQFSGRGPGQWYNNRADCSSADPVFVQVPHPTSTAIDAVLSQSGEISGTVTDRATGTPIQSVSVSVYSTGNVLMGFASTGPDGTYTVSGLSTGSYKVLFECVFCAGGYQNEWYSNRVDSNTADLAPVTAPYTTPGIDAALATASSQYPLSVARNGFCLGNVSSSENPLPYINCGTACSYFYIVGTPVILTATADPLHPNYSAFTAWGGSCIGNALTCDLFMDAARSVTATFACLPVRATGVSGFGLIQDAYTAVSVSANATIQVQVGEFAEALTFGSSVSITVKGGYDEVFGSQTGFTTVNGSLAISGGSATVENLVLK